MSKNFPEPRVLTKLHYYTQPAKCSGGEVSREQNSIRIALHGAVESVRVYLCPTVLIVETGGYL